MSKQYDIAMTLKEAELIEFTVKAIKDHSRLNDRIVKLYRDGDTVEVVRIALELNSELKRVYEDRLANFPSL